MCLDIDECGHFLVPSYKTQAYLTPSVFSFNGFISAQCFNFTMELLQ